MQKNSQNKSDQILGKLLKIVARLGYFTQQQAFEFFDESDRHHVKKALEWAQIYKHLESQNVLVPAAGEDKLSPVPGRAAQVKIFFLTRTGKNFLKKHKPEWIQFAKIGEPSGQRKKCLYHELLVVQALIWWYKNHKVVDFFGESALKSAGSDPADLRVLVDNNGIKTYDSEIVVQNSRQDIEGKSDNFTYFTPSDRQADVINSIKKTSAVIINLTAFKREQQLNVQQISYADQELIRAVELPRTAECVADHIGYDRAKTQSDLNRLVGAGLISCAEIHLEPGKTAGRRAKLYAKKGADIQLLSDKVFWLLASRLQINQSKNQFCIYRVDRKQSAVSFTDTHDKRLFYIEDVDLSLTENIRKFKNLQSFLQERTYIPACEDNLKLLPIVEPDIKILDLISRKTKK